MSFIQRGPPSRPPPTQVYISTGRLQSRLGLLQSAETTFFQATCLVSEPHEAYLELAKLKTSQGCLDEGSMHYKHYLFYRPQCLTALQELGSLLIISGSINEGRHYLLRALTQWERDVRRLVARLRYQASHPTIPFSRWFLEYLFANLSLGPPQTGFDEVRGGDKLDTDNPEERWSLSRIG